MSKRGQKIKQVFPDIVVKNRLLRQEQRNNSKIGVSNPTIDFWGSGIMKIVNSCKAAGLPTPTLEEDMGGFMVKLFKDRFTEEQLQKLGLNERQVKAVFYVKEKGRITNKEYQEINNVTEQTAWVQFKLSQKIFTIAITPTIESYDKRRVSLHSGKSL